MLSPGVLSGSAPSLITARAAAAERLKLQYPPELPISARVGDIARALRDDQVVIVAGATGSGKTTQLPKLVLELGRGRERLIGVTQPRRIAATSVAARVASELECELGREVGYQIRFEERASAATLVKFMTDGILLAEIQGDRLLERYDTLIIDEAHERSLTIDFVLGWLKRILPRRPDLKVIVSSATLETERFSRFFGGAPVIEVEGRTYPVEVLWYEPPDPELEVPEAAAAAVRSLSALDARGDILVFLPGEREIRETERELLASELRHTVVQPLYSRLSAADQRKVFANVSGRRVILATNVAETSLTIPGIVYVVDSGLARLSRYQPRTGTTSLQIEAISRASADQRKGRCGRVREGVCVRLYDEASFTARPAFTDPELKRSGLSGVILRMKALGLGEVEDFPFLDPPEPRAVTEGYRVLQELGALDDEKKLTPLGRRLAQFPVDPRIARMILAGVEEGCLAEVLVLAAALNIQDPRERPRGQEQKADERQRRFRDERSDFLGLLKLWNFVRDAQRKSTAELRRACKDAYLSFPRVREWAEVHRQLEELVREGERRGRSGRAERRAPPSAEANSPERERRIHRALLSGLLSRIGRYDAEQRIYIGAKQTRFALHPSSALAKKPPSWVMAFELVETSRLFARTAAKLEPEWLDQVGHHLLKRSYGDPHWSERSAKSVVKEQATLFGLPVFRDRHVDFAKLSPGRARLMFIEHALVRGEYKSRGAFAERNRALLAEVARLRDKARRSDMLADDEALFAFFDQRVPESVVSGKTFEDWRERAEAQRPGVLELELEDVLVGEQQLRPEDYPDRLVLHGVEVPLSYRFDPAADDDGITLSLPLALLPQLSPGELDWTIPGWHERKLVALLEELPRGVRRDIGPLAELAASLASELVPFQGALLPALARAIARKTGVTVPESAFRPYAIPAYLRWTYRVVAENGRALAQSRELGELLERYGAQARRALNEAPAPAKWQRKGITSWDFGELPAFVTRSVLGAELRAHPALIDRGSSVDLELLDKESDALNATRAGVRRLLLLAARAQLAAYAKRVPPPFRSRNGFRPSESELQRFRDDFLARVADEAFFSAGAPLPRTRAEFDALASAGTPRLAPVFTRLERAAQATMNELNATQRALEAAARQPSGAAAVKDLRAQLEQLFPEGLLQRVSSARLEQFPRYLRAMRARLERALNDPRKDADKLAPFAPLWSAFLAKAPTASDLEARDALRWALEELRVAIFAPELKPASPVSVQGASSLLAALR